MKQLWFVLILLSLYVPSTASAQEDGAPPADDGEWTTEATAADGGDISVKIVPPPSEEGDEEDKPAAKTAVKPMATIAAPKKGKPKSAQPLGPAVPVTPIVPRNP